MTSGEKSFTKTGRMRKATFAQVCQWVLTAWRSVIISTITNGFRKAGLLRDKEEFIGFESDEGETGRVADEAILRLFLSDTEDEDFGGFSTQEEDDHEDD